MTESENAPPPAESPTAVARNLPELDNSVPQGVRAVLDAVINRSIAGVGPLKGAVEVAEEHRVVTFDAETAIERLVRTHVRLAAASGFLTGLGGVVTLPVAVPAGIGGLYLIGARMTASIAHLRGHDVHSEDVRSAISVCLIGSAAATGAKRAGVEATSRFLTASIRRMPARPLVAINRAVGFRLVTKAGTTGVVNLSRAVPLVGGPISGAVDVAACRAIGRYARKVFGPVTPEPLDTGPIVEAESLVGQRDDEVGGGHPD